MGDILFMEENIMIEVAQINVMILAFIEVREDDFWRFEEDKSRRR